VQDAIIGQAHLQRNLVNLSEIFNLPKTEGKIQKKKRKVGICNNGQLTIKNQSNTMVKILDINVIAHQ